MRDEKLPLVTVMIPTYNQQMYLAEAVESALSQDYPNLDVVVADDCSSDDTATVCKRYHDDARFRYVRNERNLGRVGNYHDTLYNKARGSWVVNLDGDDYFTNPHFISEAMAVALSEPDLVLVFGNCIIAWNDNRHGVIMSVNAPDRLILSGRDFLLTYPPFSDVAPPHMAAMYRRDVAMKVGFYSTDTLLADSESIYRIGIGHNVALISALAGVWRQHGSNATHTSGRALAGSHYLRAELILAAAQQSNVFSGGELQRLQNYLIAGSAVADAAYLGRDGHWWQFPRLVAQVAKHGPRPLAIWGLWLTTKTAKAGWRRIWPTHRMTFAASRIRVD